MKRGLIIFLILLICIEISYSTDFSGNSIVGINNKEGSFILVDKDGNSIELMDTLFADWEDLCLADIDGDGKDEIIGLRSFSAAINIYDFEEGKMIQKFTPEQIGNFPRDMEWVGIKGYDIDGDGKEELILLDNKNGRFHLIDYDSNTFSTRIIGGTTMRDWVGFDIGKIEDKITIIAIRQDKNPLYIFDYINGQLSERINIGEQIGNNKLSGISIFDIDGDGTNEIIVLSNGIVFVGVKNNEFYNLKLKQEVSHKEIKRISYGNILNDGSLKLHLLDTLQFPFLYYNLRDNTLLEKTINYNKNLQWVGFDIGNIGYISEEKQEIILKEEEPKPVIEKELELVVEQQPVAPQEETEDKSNSSVWIGVFISLIILIGAGIALYFFKFRKEDESLEQFYEKVDEDLKRKSDKKLSQEKPKTIQKEVKKEEPEEIFDPWIKKGSRDLDSLKDIIRNKKDRKNK